MKFVNPAIYSVKRLLHPTITLIFFYKVDAGVAKAVSILCISSSFLFNTVRLAILNTVKNSNTTEGVHTRSQDILEYIQRSVSVINTTIGHTHSLSTAIVHEDSVRVFHAL